MDFAFGFHASSFHSSTLVWRGVAWCICVVVLLCSPLDISYDNIHKLLAYQFTGYEFPRKGQNNVRQLLPFALCSCVAVGGLFLTLRSLRAHHHRSSVPR
eukprot:TRINITY_DN3220_c0_g1_i1.p2 TRINITY_DN3220_c0_g1~~TRINITY_DN3220_c0_g1_i1.p2  ORF type:complete len:100 (+),score=12.91 TRINITY_DN3220_c0_g1_i1:189-488(+)